MFGRTLSATKHWCPVWQAVEEGEQAYGEAYDAEFWELDVAGSSPYGLFLLRFYSEV